MGVLSHMAKVIGETIGRLVQWLGFDGTYFRPPLCTPTGRLLVVEEDLETLTKSKQVRRWEDCWAWGGYIDGSSGYLNIPSDAVPAGYLLVVCAASTFIQTGSATSQSLSVEIDGVEVRLSTKAPAVVN